MISIHGNAHLDARQKQVIYRIQPFTIGTDLQVTRGHSTPEDQLRIIEKIARDNKCIFSEFETGNITWMAPIWRDGMRMQLYTWQQTWSMLLFKGFIVNPPLRAECLDDYINAAGVNMKGSMIDPSPHITSDPIDFSDKVNNVPNIALVASILAQAKSAGAGIRYIKQEPRNHCVHIDLEKEAA